MNFSFCAALLLANLAHGFPRFPAAGSSASTVSSTTNYTAKFETPELMAPTFPGVYDDLYFDLFELGPYSYAAGMPAGVAPQSFPNEAVFGHGFTEPEGPAVLSADYDGSNVTMFQLFDFYFGCQAQYNYTYPGGSQVINFPQNCTLLVNGYFSDAASDPPEVFAFFEFVPEYQFNSHVGVQYSTMMHAVLPETFNGLRVVTFEAVNTSSTALSTPAVYMDNVSFSVTNKTDV